MIECLHFIINYLQMIDQCVPKEIRKVTNHPKDFDKTLINIKTKPMRLASSTTVTSVIRISIVSNAEI